MTKITVMGGSICGLLTALLLAEDGHDVTVLERDAAPPPADAEESWDSWERRGVRQFHMGHWFHSGFRMTLERELPQVVEALDAVGALRLNVVDNIPDEISGGHMEGDERYEVLTGRRPVMEAAIAGVAEAHPNIEVRRGVAVAALTTEVRDGVPHVTGVVTDAGEAISADMLVDAAGRQSPTTRLLTEAGCVGPIVESEDSGFIYYGRSFRSADGSLPIALGGLLHVHDSISVLTLPADHGTWFIGIVAAGSDAALRAVRDVDVWTKVIQAYPLIAHWLDGEALSDVEAMGKIEDRLRRFVVDGTPVATGFAAVADAWACTNPSLGRGSTIGLYHAVHLRDQLREDPTVDPIGWALRWEERTATHMEPWYTDTLRPDRLRLAEIEAQVAGETFETDDVLYDVMRRFDSAGFADPKLLRRRIDNALMMCRMEEILDDAEVMEKLMAADVEAPMVLGPDRAELLALLS